MNNYTSLLLSFGIIYCGTNISIHGYSLLRQSNEVIPEISVSYVGDSETFSVKDSHFEAHPIFSSEFFIEDCLRYRLPKTRISHADHPEHFSSCAEINRHISSVISEIKQRKKRFTHFIVLQDKNFSYKDGVGLLVLKFKDHPFVLKLFFETPRTFLDRYTKGMESYVFVYMAGGANRHVLGFLRIPNRALLRTCINAHPHWKDIVLFPRKWFWVDPHEPWLFIRGKNLGDTESVSVTIPATYAIIADAIDKNETAELSFLEKRNLIMQLARDLGFALDPHRPNFIFKGTPSGGYTISVIDTEHHPSCVGYKNPQIFTGYISWYLDMTGKFLHDTFGRSRRSRQLAQRTLYNYPLLSSKDYSKIVRSNALNSI